MGRAAVLMLVLAAVLIVHAGAQSSDRAELLFQAATQKELVEGDLQQAITMYRSVVASAGANRRLAATALVQMARCYEKLGSVDGRRVYEQVLREYADQPEAVAIARARLSVIDRPAANRSPSMTVRRVTARANVDGMVDVSSDGRYLSAPDWDTGNLVLIDLATGQQFCRRPTGTARSARTTRLRRRLPESLDGSRRWT